MIKKKYSSHILVLKKKRGVAFTGLHGLTLYFFIVVRHVKTEGGIFVFLPPPPATGLFLVLPAGFDLPV